MRSAMNRPTEHETDLSGFQLFNKLTEEEFGRLNFDKTCSVHKKSTVIYREGSRLTGFYCVTRGIVKIFKTGIVSEKLETNVHSQFARGTRKIMPKICNKNCQTCINACPVQAISFLKERGANDCVMASLIAAPEGVKRLSSDHPDVPIYTAVLDRELNEHGFILPGLGDAGDRTFGTL